MGTVVEFGYLNVEAGYLAGPYSYLSTGKIEDTNGAQMTAIVQKAEPFGAQFNAPQVQISYGSQFKGVVYKATSFGMEFNSSKIVHYSCGDGLYLSYGNYLNNGGGYLAPEVCAFVGAQFSAVVNQENLRGAQLRGINPELVSFGSQFQGKITDNIPNGAQLRSVNLEETPIGAQVRGINPEVVSFGAQTRGINPEAIPVGAQVTAVRAEFFGAQFRVVLYNTTQIRVLCDFPSRGDGTSWTVQNGGTTSSSSNSFDVNNLNTDIVEQVYRSTSSANVQLVCDTGVPQGVFVDTLGILNHNFTRGAVVTLEGSNDPGFATSTTVVVPVTLVNAYWLSPDAPLEAFRYWRLTVQDPTNPNGYVQIGTVVFGSADVFTVQDNFVDRVIFGQKHFTDKVFTEGHTNVSNDRGKKKYLTLEFKNLVYQRPNWNILDTLFSTYGTTHKCLWIPTPSTPGRFAVFGKLSELPQEEHNYKDDDADYVAVTLNIDESL